jgi:hypothetical protein
MVDLTFVLHFLRLGLQILTVLYDAGFLGTG